MALDDEWGAGATLGWDSADAQHIVGALENLTEQVNLANQIAYLAIVKSQGGKDAATNLFEAEIQQQLGLI